MRAMNSSLYAKTVILVIPDSDLVHLSLMALQKEILDKLGRELSYDLMMETW